MSDIARLVKHSSIYAVGNALSKAAAFLLLPIYTHYLTAGEYGELELFYSLSTVVSSFLGFGLSHATLRFYFEYDDQARRNRVVPTAMLASLAISLPVAALLAAFSDRVADMFFDGAGRRCVLIILATVVLELNRQIGIAYLRAREYSLMFVAVTLGQLLIQFAANIIAVVYLEMGVEGILFGNMLSVLASVAVLDWICLRECGAAAEFGIIREILNYSYPFLFTSITGILASNADRFIIKAYISSEALGLYALALKFGMILDTLVLESFQRGFGSFRFSIMKQDNAPEIFARVFNYLTAAMLACGLAIGLFSREALMLMSPPEYWSVSRLVPVVVASVVIQGYSYVFQTGILFQKSTAPLLYISIIPSIILVGLDFVLIPVLGAFGAAAALVAKSAVSVVLTYIASNRVYPVKYEFAPAAKVLCLSLAAGGAVYILPESEVLASFAVKACVFAAVVYAILRSSLFNAGELLAVTSYMRRMIPSARRL